MSTFRSARVALSFATLALSIAVSASAHNDPSSCSRTVQSGSIAELRDLVPGTQCSGGPSIGVDCTSDDECPQGACSLGDSPISGLKVQGETIYYEATLDFSSASGACAYEGGKTCIDVPSLGCPSSNPSVSSFRCVGGTSPNAPCPPDSPVECSGGGVCTAILGTECCDVTPTKGVPLICVGCTTAGVSDIVTRQVAYTVDYTDRNARCTDPESVRAVFNYFNGTSHRGADEFPLDASQPICNPVVTPTPSRTPAPPLHFACYAAADRTRFAKRSVDLVDRFGAASGEVSAPFRLCNPTDKNHEDPSASTDPNHLVAYELRLDPPFVQRRDVTLTNQFGTAVVDVVAADALLVPSAKSLTSAPQPLASAIDHFTCYTVAHARFRGADISIDDQFGSRVIDIKRPVRLCTPVDKNGEGVHEPNRDMLCYAVRNASGSPSFRGVADVHIDNQFGSDEVDVFGLRELCVPSRIAP